MNKHQPADDILRELWTIKDETAARFKTAAQYFAHLGLPPAPKPRATRATPTVTASKALPALGRPAKAKRAQTA